MDKHARLGSRLLRWALALIPYLATFAAYQVASQLSKGTVVGRHQHSGEIRICAALPGLSGRTVEPPD